MSRDPIVEEIHQARKQIMAECGNDPQKYFARLKAIESTHPDRVVYPSKRKRGLAPAPK